MDLADKPYEIGDVIQSIETHTSPSIEECIETPADHWWVRFVKIVVAETEDDVDIVYGKYTLNNESCICSCRDWAGIWDFGNYSYKHHYNCEHYDDTIIEVVRVSLDGNCYYEKSMSEALEHKNENDSVKFEYMFMEKSNYEELPEFEGF
jgi:hypothetical protein